MEMDSAPSNKTYATETPKQNFTNCHCFQCFVMSTLTLLSKKRIAGASNLLFLEFTTRGGCIAPTGDWCENLVHQRDTGLCGLSLARSCGGSHARDAVVPGRKKSRPGGRPGFDATRLEDEL